MLVPRIGFFTQVFSLAPTIQTACGLRCVIMTENCLELAATLISCYSSIEQKQEASRAIVLQSERRSFPLYTNNERNAKWSHCCGNKGVIATNEYYYQDHG